MLAPENEHELKATYQVDLFYINEPEPRKPSAVFREMKRCADKINTVCAISGQPKPQYHHLICEYAARDEIDWHLVKGVATGEVKELPVLDLTTNKPVPGQYFDAQKSLCYYLCKWVEICFNMDWKEFDPKNPISFVDSIHNMLPLNAKFHIHKDHGIHLAPFPEYVLQCFPKIAGFSLMPDDAPLTEEEFKMVDETTQEEDKVPADIEAEIKEVVEEDKSKEESEVNVGDDPPTK